MNPFMLSQCLVALALLCDLAAFQCRVRHRVLGLLALSCSLNAAHFALLGYWPAVGLLLVAALRFAVGVRVRGRGWMLGFMALSTLVACLGYQGPLTGLTLAASLLQTWAAFCPDDRHLRRRMVLGTLCWMGNNLLVGSPVALLMESLFLLSNLVGYWRHYGRYARG